MTVFCARMLAVWWREIAEEGCAISVNVYTIPRLTHPNVEPSKFEDVYNLLIIAINDDEYLIRVFNSTTNMETAYKFAKNYR